MDKSYSYDSVLYCHHSNYCHDAHARYKHVCETGFFKLMHDSFSGLKGKLHFYIYLVHINPCVCVCVCVCVFVGNCFGHCYQQKTTYKIYNCGKCNGHCI